MFKKLLLIIILSCGNFVEARNRWESTEFIWNFGIISKCDIGITKNPFKYFSDEHHPFEKNPYLKIESGDIVFIKCAHVKRFYKLLSKIEHPFVLVISDGDESFPSNCGPNFNVEKFIKNKKIIHIFAQNCDYKGKSKKVSHLPIGIDFHSIAYKGKGGMWGEYGSPKQQEEVLKNLLATLPPTYVRKLGAFVDFQLNDTTHADMKRYLQFGEDRTSIFNKLLPTGLIDYGQKMKRSDLWRKKSEYAFSISPHGNGLDCHRTWEDLALGCIVIVKTSPLDPLYQGLPVVIVNDWSEVTRENMIKWLAQYQDAFTNPEYRKKLTNEYWLAKIHSAARRHRK